VLVAAFTVAYTSQAGTQYNFTFREFQAEEVMRTYQPTIAYQRTVSGAQVLAGPADIPKYVWAVNAVTDKDTAEDVDEMYRAWALDRADGTAAAVAVLDETWGTIGQRTAVFSTAPTYGYVNNMFVVATFALTEV